jgi:hypothetical protein
MTRAPLTPESHPPSDPSLVVYRCPDGITNISLSLERDSLWLSLNDLSALFKRHKSTISRHLSAIFETRELDATECTRDTRLIAADGKRYLITQYNFDVIVSVGYRVNSVIGTAFRIWATKVLKQHLLDSISSRLSYSIAIDTSAVKDGDTLNRSGYVYLIRSSTGFYKIGRTKDPHSRRRTFDVKLPFEIEFVHLVACHDAVAAELALHRRFASRRAGGEWFSLTDDDVAYIQNRFRG